MVAICRERQLDLPREGRSTWPRALRCRAEVDITTSSGSSGHAHPTRDGGRQTNGGMSCVGNGREDPREPFFADWLCCP